MLEAVNSVTSNAQYTRAVAEQQSVTNSYAANPERVQQATTQAPYLSLYIKVDTNFDKAVLQIRDIDTGDVVRQIPTESQLEAYRRAQSSNAVKSAVAEDAADRLAEASHQDHAQSPQEVRAEAAPAPQPEQSTPAPVQTSSYTATSEPAPAPQPEAAPAQVDTQA